MALDVYLRRDINAAILAGLVVTMKAAQAAGNNVEYLRGALAAYQGQALAFNLSWPGILSQARQELDAGNLALLDRLQVIEIKPELGAGK